MRFTELDLHAVCVDEFERRAKARAIEGGMVDDTLDSLTRACSLFLVCATSVVLDGDATFPDAWRDAAILFEGDLEVRGALDDMGEAALVVIGGDLRASTLTITTDWLVTGSTRLAVGLAGSSSGPRRLVCEGALEAPAIVLDGYSLEIGGGDAAGNECLVDRHDEKRFAARRLPRTLHQYARAIEENRGALERSSAFFAADQAAFRAAWEACRAPADLVRAFAWHADVVFAASDRTPLGHALLRAAHEVLRRVLPLAESDVPPAEALIETWLDRGWTDDEAREASSAGGFAPAERTARAVREYAAGRLVGACRCFDRATKTWHRDEAAEDCRTGVLDIVDAIENVALDDAQRSQCEQILRERLLCPALVESKPDHR